MHGRGSVNLMSNILYDSPLPSGAHTHPFPCTWQTFSSFHKQMLKLEQFVLVSLLWIVDGFNVKYWFRGHTERARAEICKCMQTRRVHKYAECVRRRRSRESSAQRGHGQARQWGGCFSGAGTPCYFQPPLWNCTACLGEACRQGVSPLGAGDRLFINIQAFSQNAPSLSFQNIP